MIHHDQANRLLGSATQFLEAIAKAEDADRRRYERIDGNGAEATLRPVGQPEFRALIIDIARGGVALRTDWWAAAGAEVQVLLPGTDAPVGARTARTNDGVLALAFRQDEAMLRQVDASLSHIGALAGGQAGGVSRMRRLGMNFRGAHSARSAMAVPT